MTIIVFDWRYCRLGGVSDRFCEGCCGDGALAAVAGVLSSAILVGGGGGVAADAAPLADAGMVTVGVTVLPGAGVATMRLASLADVGEVALGVTDTAVAGAVPLANAGGMFPAAFPGQVAAGTPVKTDDVSVNVVGIQTCAAWGDRFSPGVWCRDKTLGWQNCDFRPAGSLCSGWVRFAGYGGLGAGAGPPWGHVEMGHRWDRVAMDLLDMSVTTPKGNRYVLVIVDSFSRWTEACPLPNKMAC